MPPKTEIKGSQLQNIILIIEVSLKIALTNSNSNKNFKRQQLFKSNKKVESQLKYRWLIFSQKYLPINNDNCLIFSQHATLMPTM